MHWPPTPIPMLPEISRRCPSCGASIRERAIFCPECGQPQTKNSEVEKPAAVAAAVPANAETVSAETIEAAPSPPSTAAAAVQPAPQLEGKSITPEPDGSGKKLLEQTPSVSRRGKHEKARERLQRASAATRDALADNVKRVEKIRHVSTAMIEEASYDPSLRFVLVALGLFVVFVILLVLSKVMG